MTNVPFFFVPLMNREDNRMNWTVASANLKRMGYEADWVTNGLLSVGAVKEKHYDLVLMDIQASSMFGSSQFY